VSEWICALACGRLAFGGRGTEAALSETWEARCRLRARCPRSFPRSNSQARRSSVPVRCSIGPWLCGNSASVRTALPYRPR
jgi:hypothetical protein